MLLTAVLALAIEPASPDYAGHCQVPKWSPDGRYLSWEVNFLERKAVELYVALYGSGSPPRRIAPSTRSTSSITAGFSAKADRSVVHEISFSPPSLNRFVFGSSGSSEDYDLYLDGLGPLAASAAAEGNPSWSPDGTRIVFTSSRTGQGDLYMVDLAEIERPPLQLSGDTTASELYAAWSPDSTKLVFVGHTSRGDNLYLIENVAFPAPRPLTTSRGTHTRPSFSPDGTQIAYFSNEGDADGFDLYILPLNGKPIRVATEVVLNAGGPAWTPDGKWLVYVKHDNDNFNPVWAVPVADPSKARMVATGTVGNADIHVARRVDGRTWLALAAQGRVGDAVRDFRRIYALALTLP